MSPARANDSAGPTGWKSRRHRMVCVDQDRVAGGRVLRAEDDRAQLHPVPHRDHDIPSIVVLDDDAGTESCAGRGTSGSTPSAAAQTERTPALTARRGRMTASLGRSTIGIDSWTLSCLRSPLSSLLSRPLQAAVVFVVRTHAVARERLECQRVIVKPQRRHDLVVITECLLAIGLTTRTTRSRGASLPHSAHRAGG